MKLQKLFADLKIGTKLGVGFAAIILLLIVTVIISFTGLMNVRNRVDKGDDVNKLEKKMLNTRRQEKNFILRGDQPFLVGVENGIEFLKKQALETKEKFNQKENKDQMDAVIDSSNAYIIAFRDFVDLKIGKNNSMTIIRQNAKTALDVIEEMRSDQKTKMLDEIKKGSGDTTNRVTKADDANRLIKLFLEAGKNEKEYIISNGDKQWIDTRKNLISQIYSLAADMKIRFIDPVNDKQIDDAVSAIKAYESSFNVFCNYMKQQKEVEDEMMNAARKVEKECKDARIDQNAKMERSISSAITLIIIFSILSIIFGMFFAIIITRSISKPLSTTVVLAEKISVGEMDIDIIETDRKDEVGKLLQAFNKMSTFLIRLSRAANSIAEGDMTINVIPLSDKDTMGIAFKTMLDGLKEKAAQAEEIANGNLTIEVKLLSDKDTMGIAFKTMVDKIRSQIRAIIEGVNVLTSSASEIMATVTELASGAAETSTSVGETTTTVEEVKQTAEVSNIKATGVSESSQKTLEISQDGTRAIKDALEGMNRVKQQMESTADIVVRLSEQSETIGEISAAVNDLAEQSNLLSVNASIEAAKAGEHGKGFAIVAKEIKNLAEQSKEANTQIRGILNDVQKSISSAVMATEEGGRTVDEGLNLFATAGDAIKTLSESVAEAAHAAIQIAASSHQQLTGMDQIVTAMESIKEASAQSAAGTKQTETTAQDLHTLGEKMQVLTKQYKV